MTAANNEGVQRCIKEAISSAGMQALDIDVINAHLTATSKDATEISNWSRALGRVGESFPYVQAVKSHIGHCLSASGSIECVAAILQVKNGFLFPNLNCEDLHQGIQTMVAATRIPRKLILREIEVVAKASFGFGDVNACVLLKKYRA